METRCQPWLREVLAWTRTLPGSDHQSFSMLAIITGSSTRTGLRACLRACVCVCVLCVYVCRCECVCVLRVCMYVLIRMYACRCVGV